MSLPASAAAVTAAELTLTETDRVARRFRLSPGVPPVTPFQIRAQFRLLVDLVMGEAGLYDPDLAALALKQTEGDTDEAVVVLRATRQTLERRYVSRHLDTRGMWVERRISSAFREIPGGQILGPTLDYSQRLLNLGLAAETPESIDGFLREFEQRIDRSRLQPVRTFGKVTDLLRAEGLLRAVYDDEDRTVHDLTRQPLRFPAPRSARLQALARAQTGAIMALGYSGMRGQGGDHPTIGEVRVGLAAVVVVDTRGRTRTLGRIRVTEAENISKIKVKKRESVPYLSLGYGLCFGQNETKAICMGILDRTMRMGGDGAPAISQEFVLYHTEGADAWGSVHSVKAPDHAGFASDLDLLRAAVARRQARNEESVSRAGNTVR